jgi:hypothetical protein
MLAAEAMLGVFFCWGGGLRGVYRSTYVGIVFRSLFSKPQ